MNYPNYQNRPKMELKMDELYRSLPVDVYPRRRRKKTRNQFVVDVLFYIKIVLDISTL